MNETQIESDPNVPLVRITREFDAPVAKVFRAHTDPELVARWLGPRQYEMVIDHHDCRTGGSYRYRHVAPGEEHAFRGTFHEVRDGEVIVQTFAYDGMPDSVALERVVFTDLGDGRTRLVGTSLVDSFEARDAFVASGMEHGVRESYERLDEILAAVSV
ncbi:MAG TPA: SRPBCC family protein [Mycobacteriales bacterium]|nr:SRPBCC family protein [Mycobacteriales bacterium]